MSSAPPSPGSSETTTGHGGSHKAVFAALLANVCIAVSKFVGFALTRSSSMGSEAAHSVVDCGNQLLLLTGAKKASRPADDKHPFGHGPETFFWAFLVAVALFGIGAVYSAFEGVAKLRHPGTVDHAAIAFGILLVAMVLEGLSFRTATKESNKSRKGSWPGFIRDTKDPDLAVVLLEDSAALVGLTLALLGLGLSTITGNTAFDGIASLLIAVVLATVAVILGREMKSLLVGEAARPEDLAAITAAIVEVSVFERVIYVRTKQLSPDEMLVAAKVAVDGNARAADIAEAVDKAERRVRAAVPAAKYIFIEPDIEHQGRSEDAVRGEPAATTPGAAQS
jgi:cation diffusion facilitator family transporter